MSTVLRKMGLSLAVIATLVVSLLAMVVTSPAGAATLSPVNGGGSTYAGLAFAQWTADVSSTGLNVNYTETSSPTGLSQFAGNTLDFAGTEAEYSEETPEVQDPPRGFAYTPDVAGAIAIMYNVDDAAGQPVNYLHLSRLTIAKIFLGDITNWDDPEISEDNKGLVLPDEPIRVDYRSGQSGTTALFMDFVKNTDPTDWTSWGQHGGGGAPNNCAFGGSLTAPRVWEVDDCGEPYSNGQAQTGSDQQAQFIAGSSGLWSIGYDEFGYAGVYNDNVAWVENAAGDWVQPYAQNITAALQSAVLAPDTSEDLTGVYASTNPLAYPLSAYSYILYQCAATAARPTCITPYTNPGVMNTMAQFMAYIACQGQVKMASIGYAPLPPQLSQFMMNAVGYMTGQPPETVTAQNCANPTLDGSDGTGSVSPPDPTKSVPSEGPGPGGSSSGSSGASGSGATAGSSTGSTGGTAAASATTTTVATLAGGASEAGKAGSGTASVGGGTSNTLPLAPAAYHGPVQPGLPPWPFVVLLAVLLVPVVVLSLRKQLVRRSGPGRGQPPP